jgi:hypothetical protein
MPLRIAGWWKPSATHAIFVARRYGQSRNDHDQSNDEHAPSLGPPALPE